MIDMATRPQALATNSAAVFGLPFDWRLCAPMAAADMPYTDFGDPCAPPVLRTELLASYALELEDTLQTAIILSLFSDARAGVDDALPLGHTQRRGWVGDSFGAVPEDAWGSKLWLCYFGKVSGQVLEQARFAAQQALAWLVRDGIASRVEVATQWVGERLDRLAVRPTIYQGAQVLPVYDVLWGTSIRKLAQ